jgi:hypothetical protein
VQIVDNSCSAQIIVALRITTYCAIAAFTDLPELLGISTKSVDFHDFWRSNGCHLPVKATKSAIGRRFLPSEGFQKVKCLWKVHITGQ